MERGEEEEELSNVIYSIRLSKANSSSLKWSRGVIALKTGFVTQLEFVTFPNLTLLVAAYER